MQTEKESLSIEQPLQQPTNSDHFLNDFKKELQEELKLDKNRSQRIDEILSQYTVKDEENKELSTIKPINTEQDLDKQIDGNLDNVDSTLEALNDSEWNNNSSRKPNTDNTDEPLNSNPNNVEEKINLININQGIRQAEIYLKQDSYMLNSGYKEDGEKEINLKKNKVSEKTTSQEYYNAHTLKKDRYYKCIEDKEFNTKAQILSDRESKLNQEYNLNLETPQDELEDTKDFRAPQSKVITIDLYRRSQEILTKQLKESQELKKDPNTPAYRRLFAHAVEKETRKRLEDSAKRINVSQDRSRLSSEVSRSIEVFV